MTRYRCSDCGISNMPEGGGYTPNFCSVITHQGESRVYCPTCRARRPFRHLFDGRTMDEIAADPGDPPTFDQEPTPDGNDSTAEERAAEARDQMDAIFLGLK